jgi:hypothetical protein
MYFVLQQCSAGTLKIGTYQPAERDSQKTITLVNTQNVSVTKIVDSSSIQRAETKYGLRIQFLALVFMIHEVRLNA